MCIRDRAYTAEYGRRKGLAKLDEDRKAVKKGGAQKGKKAKKKAKA